MKKLFTIVVIAAVLLAVGIRGYGQEVRFICQDEVVSGEKVPVIVRFYNSRGQLDTSVNQTVTLTAPGASLSKTSIQVIRGAGSVTPTVSANSSFTLSVAGFSGSKAVSLISSRAYTSVSGRIDNVRTWTAGSTYRVTGDLKIGSSGKLTIEAGTQVFLDRDVNVEVSGGLVVTGSENDPVVFHAYESAAWGGIEFNASDGEANLRWMILTAGGGDTDRLFGHSDSQPVIKVVDTEFFMDNCFLIDNEGKGMSTHQSINHVTNSLLARCDTGAEFRYSTNIIDGFYSMFMPDEDGIIADNDNDGIYFARESNSNPQPHLISNVVVYGVEDDGIDFNGEQEAVITNAFVANVYDKGISTTDEVNIQVSYSVFARCNDYGIAFKDVCEVEIDNCTFYDNRIDFKAYNDNLGNGEGKLEGYNLIFANTRGSLFDIDRDARYSIQYSISNTSAVSGTGNITGDPLLKDPANLDFRLQAGSPAIDSGNPSSPNDPDGSRSDMGAFHFNAFSAVEVIPTELDYRPVVEGISMPSHEFIELYNPGKNAADLSGFIVSGAISYQFAAGDILQSGEYLILVKDLSEWNVNQVHVHQWTSGDLPDQSGTVKLETPDGDVVFEFTWQSQSPWPIPTSIHHYPVALKATDSNYQLASNWQVSRVYGGTPGKDNGSVPDMDLLINEVMAENGGIVEDPSGQAYDWIELVNAGEEFVNIGGLWLTNNPADPDKSILSADNFDLSTLGPGEYVVLWASGTSTPGRNYLNFSLNSPVGQLNLAFPTTSGSFLLDMVTYSGLTKDVSYARIPDQGGTWTVTTVPTPGAANRQAFDQVLEGIVINEFLARNGSIYPDETGAYSDWIELYNTTTKAINLAGLYLSDDESDPMKYRIPAGFEDKTTIPALGYLLFRADARTELGPLHADFQLASNGEELTLSQFFNGEVHILDQIAYDIQLEDVSYGRFPDGTGHWEYFNRPTPLARNSSNSSELMAWDPAYPISIYPNPASEFVQVQIGGGHSETPRISLISTQGKTIKTLNSGHLVNTSGDYLVRDSLAGIPSGLYYLIIDYPDKRMARKLMLAR